MDALSLRSDVMSSIKILSPAGRADLSRPGVRAVLEALKSERSA